MKRILLVDDQPHVLRILKMALEKENYQVDTAPNGEVALMKIKELFPDVMVTDLQMPRMNGQELCLRITEEIPDRKFLICILTSRMEFEHRNWARSVDNLIFMEKPVSIRKLIELLQLYFEAKTTEGGNNHGK